MSVPLPPKRELSIPEMLADPIVQKVMARDGVTELDIEDLVAAVRSRLRRKPALAVAAVENRPVRQDLRSAARALPEKRV